MQKINACLSFKDNAEVAVKFYTSVFKNSKVVRTAYWGDNAPAPIKPGSVLTIEFQIEGQDFIALNGGPEYIYNKAISLMVNCKTQVEIDAYWEKLSEGGQILQCGWLTDKFGVTWQIAPVLWREMLTSPDKEKAQRAMAAMMKMIKIDMDAMQRAFDGKTSDVGHQTAV